MIRGTAHVYGDDLNTDLIIAGKYTKSLNIQDFADHCLEDLDPEFVHRVKKGDVLVAGENFGCGSSREQAPVALKAAGISVVAAKSYARIFYRNAINVGLPLVILDTDGIHMGDSIAVDIISAIVTVNDTDVRRCQQLPKVMRDILDEGGLVNYLKKNFEFNMNESN